MKNNRNNLKKALESLIKIGKAAGYLTVNEINNALSGLAQNPTEIDSIISVIKELNIVVSDEKPGTNIDEVGIFVSKEYAKNNNLKKYFTGKSCNNGHYSERYLRNGECTECVRLQKKRRRVRKKTLVKESNKSTYFTGISCINGHIAERYHLNNTCVECHNIFYKSKKTNIKNN